MSAVGKADFLVEGDWNASCWECGRKFKASTMRRHWAGYYVCEQHWEPRQVQDFVRSVSDVQTPPWVQPMADKMARAIIEIPWSAGGSTITEAVLSIIGNTVTLTIDDDDVVTTIVDPGEDIIVVIPPDTVLDDFIIDDSFADSVVTIIVNNGGTVINPLVTPSPPPPIQWNGNQYGSGNYLLTAVDFDNNLFGYELDYGGSILPTAYNSIEIWRLETDDVETVFHLAGILAQDVFTFLSVNGTTMAAADAIFAIGPDWTSWTWTQPNLITAAGVYNVAIF